MRPIYDWLYFPVYFGYKNLNRGILDVALKLWQRKSKYANSNRKISCIYSKNGRSCTDNVGKSYALGDLSLPIQRFW